MRFRALSVLSPRSTCERLVAHARDEGRAVIVVETALDEGIDAVLRDFGRAIAPGRLPFADLAALERAVAALAVEGKTTLFVVEPEPSDDSDGRALRKLRDGLRGVANDRLEIVLLRGSTSDESE